MKIINAGSSELPELTTPDKVAASNSWAVIYRRGDTYFFELGLRDAGIIVRGGQSDTISVRGYSAGHNLYGYVFMGTDRVIYHSSTNYLQLGRLVGFIDTAGHFADTIRDGSCVCFQDTTDPISVCPRKT